MTHMDTPTSCSLNAIKASTQVLAFDIFGTVVDWHGSIVREIQALYPSVDGNAFALAWRAGY
jgi:2-haloacid dehalogenase